MTNPVGSDRPRKIYTITNKGLIGQNNTVLTLVNKMIEVTP